MSARTSRLTPLVAGLLAITLTSNVAVVAAEQIQPGIRVTGSTATEADQPTRAYSSIPEVSRAAAEARQRTLDLRAAQQLHHEARRRQAKQQATTAAAEQATADQAAKAAAAQAAKEQATAAPAKSPVAATSTPSRGNASSGRASSGSRAPAPSGGSGSAPTAPAPSPKPSPTASPAPSCDNQCRVDRAVDRLEAPLPSGWKVEVGSGNGPLGMAHSGTKTITLWPRDWQSDDNLLFTLYHEVGHAYDFDRLNTNKRHQWANARGYSPDPWFGCNGCEDFDTPAGDWAESFAYCHTGWSQHYASRMGGVPTSSQCNLLMSLKG